MSTNTIIFVIVVLLSAIIRLFSTINEAKKRKEQERRRQERDRATSGAGAADAAASTVPRDRGIVFGTESQAVGSLPKASPLLTRTGTPVDDVAVRRKAQIEQLRTRREGRRVGQPIQNQAGSAPTLTTPTSVRGGGTSPAALPAEWTKPREQDKRERELASARREQRTNEAQQRKANGKAARRRQQEANAAYASERTAAKSAPTDKPIDEASATKHASESRRTSRSSGLRLQLGQPGSLRDAIILRELLDRPLALRQDSI